MGIAGGLARHDPQTEPFGGVIGGGLQPPVVEHQRFAFGAFEVKLPVVGPGQGSLENRQGFVGCDVNAVEEGGRRNMQGHAG